MKQKKYSFTTKYTIIIGLVVLLANIALSVVLILQSRSGVVKLIRQNMLFMANTAAAQMDGDLLKEFSAEDVGTREWAEICRELQIFKDNNEIEYIYTVKKDEAGEYVFLIDPDPVDPAEFGRETVYTPALISAGNGVAAVDDHPVADAWGNFYSAYSPVYDSNGQVAAVVGIDFDSSWYDSQILVSTLSAVGISLVSLLAGGIIVFIVTSRLRNKFNTLYGELSALAENVEELNSEIEEKSRMGGTAGVIIDRPEKEEPFDPKSGDAIEELGGKIQNMRQKLKEYIDYVHEQAYVDGMTGVGNKTAYLDLVNTLNQKIRTSSSVFSVAVFDINGLKEVNDNYGHEIGDRIITDSAMLIQRVFGTDNVYRIGGDEFIVVLEGTGEDEIKELFARLDKEVADFNANLRSYPPELSFSKGLTSFEPGKDTEFRLVFRRADEAMYRDKGEYYEQNGDHRKKLLVEDQEEDDN